MHAKFEVIWRSNGPDIQKLALEICLCVLLYLGMLYMLIGYQILWDDPNIYASLFRV